MGKKTNPRYFLIILIITIFIGYPKIYAQEKMNYIVGAGILELINIGLRYQLDQKQIGISIGTLPGGDNLISISGDFFYHFAGTSELSKRKPWYGRCGLNYLKSETTELTEKITFFYIRFGKDFNISEQLGIALDAGLAFELDKERVRKRPSDGFNIDLDFPIFPSVGLTLYFRNN